MTSGAASHPSRDALLAAALRVESPRAAVWLASGPPGVAPLPGHLDDRPYLVVAVDPQPLLTLGPGADAVEARGELARVLDAIDTDGAWPCGVVGAIAYEAAPWFDSALVVRAGGDAPLAELFTVDAAIVADLRTGGLHTVTTADCAPQRVAAARDLLLRLATAPLPSELAEPLAMTPEWDCTPGEYARRVGVLLEGIAAGEYYEVNLTARFAVQSAAPPAVLFPSLLARSRPAYPFYFATPDRTILCASPELFLRSDGREVVTEPVKGTWPRPHPDAPAPAPSAKDLAEHTMVVDLARNDLGRAARYGTVEPCGLYSIRAHPALFHMATPVRATLRDECTLTGLLDATFPAASITGAPKVRVMQTIAGIESSPRGSYTGAIGWFGPGRTCELAVAIRTLEARLHGADSWLYTGGSGGAIVADSLPAAEWEEVLQKAASVGNGILWTDSVNSRQLDL